MSDHILELNETTARIWHDMVARYGHVTIPAWKMKELREEYNAKLKALGYGESSQEHG